MFSNKVSSNNIIIKISFIFKIIELSSLMCNSYVIKVENSRHLISKSYPAVSLMQSIGRLQQCNLFWRLVLANVLFLVQLSPPFPAQTK